MEKKKSSNKLHLISKIIYVIFLIMLVSFVIYVLSLGIVPSKYVVVLAFITAIILIIFGILIIKKEIKGWIRGIFSALASMNIIVILLLFIYLLETFSFIDHVFIKDYQIDNYYIIVKTDSIYDTIKSIENKNLGTYTNNISNYKKAIEKLKEKIKYKSKLFDSYYDGVDRLLNGDIDALLISSSHYEIMSEAYSNFKTDTRILDKIIIKIPRNKVPNNKKIEDSFTVYISSTDIEGDISTTAKSALNMLVTVNLNTNKVLLTSIPTDYYVDLKDLGYKDRLAYAGFYGIDKSISTIESFMGIDIDYYIRLNYTNLKNVVDAIDGIDIYNDTKFTSQIDKNCKYEQGNIHLDGRCTLAYARERFLYKEGDRKRVINQQNVLKAIINKSLTSKTIILKYFNILKSMSNSFETNITQKNIIQLINYELDKMPNWKFDSYNLNGTDDMKITYSSPNREVYVMEPDLSTITTAKNNILKLLKEN